VPSAPLLLIFGTPSNTHSHPPPFLAMILAFIVGCLTPVRDLLFSQGGHLRFLGAALQTLGTASSPMSTMVVAASLVPRKDQEQQEEQQQLTVTDNEEHAGISAPCSSSDIDTDEEQLQSYPQEVENMDSHSNRTKNESEENRKDVIMSDPNFGPDHLRRRSSIHYVGRSIRRSSMKAWTNVRRTPPEQRRLHLWFTLSKLILSPAFVIMTIVGLDCSGSGILDRVPDLAKLVLVVNASVPGALIVVVLLKSNPDLHETAAVVAKVYFPSYILSIVTIAGWTAAGLLVSIPDEDGNPFCSRF
jgi:hypothetical protein